MRIPRWMTSFLIGFLLLDLFVWGAILFGGPAKATTLYFLDVGQGDSQFIELPGGAQVLVDAGPGKGVIRELDRVLKSTDRYIDLVLLTHPQMDHFEGFIEVLRRYRVGAFISNGARGTAKSFSNLEQAVRESGVPIVVLGEGDRIRIGESRMDVLSPSPELVLSNEPNDGAIVLLLESNGMRSLFTGDIGAAVEERIVNRYNIRSDALKVAHHGSRFSSSREFLAEVAPAVAVIGVGHSNTYGHPAPETLSRLTAAGARIFRTDKDGTVRVTAKDGKLTVSKTGKGPPLRE